MQFEKFWINMKVNLMVQTQKLGEEIHQSESFLMPAFTGEEVWCVYHPYLIKPHIILLYVAHRAKRSEVLINSVRCAL